MRVGVTTPRQRGTIVIIQQRAVHHLSMIRASSYLLIHWVHARLALIIVGLSSTNSF